MVEFIDASSQSPVVVNAAQVIAFRPSPDVPKTTIITLVNGETIAVQGDHKFVMNELSRKLPR
ncbi:MAG: hypothetical protein KatS3mg105_1836 [Gemmatales bacterium]|nr:MAG: hypothetical protein KatS3mg105_1836 [Gemmatales bacterium]